MRGAAVRRPGRRCHLHSRGDPGGVPAGTDRQWRLIDGGVVSNTPVSHAVELGAQRIYVLPRTTDRANSARHRAAPNAAREVLARLRAILRRAELGSDEPVLECRDVHIDLAARVVSSGDEEIRLTPIEFRLLRALLANRGRLITHDALLRQAWGAAYAEDRQPLRAHVANLRRKLGSTDAHSLIRTYHGAGYLFEGWDSERSTRARPVPLSKPHVVVATDNPQHPRPELDEIPARRRISDATYRPAA